jgi:hypothetical protein
MTFAVSIFVSDYFFFFMKIHPIEEVAAIILGPNEKKKKDQNLVFPLIHGLYFDIT